MYCYCVLFRPLEDPENDVLCLEVWWVTRTHTYAVNNNINYFDFNLTALFRDFDAAETVPEKMSKVKDVKGVRGLVKLAKEIAVTATTGSHDNEFIGRCRISLKVTQIVFSNSFSFIFPYKKKMSVKLYNKAIILDQPVIRSVEKWCK